MPLPRVKCRAAVSPKELDSYSHVLYLLPAGDKLPADLPAAELWRAVLKRRDSKAADLAKSPLALDLPRGGRVACVMVDAKQTRFERLTALRKGVSALLEETPAEIAIIDWGAGREAALDAVYVASVNGEPLPARKKKAAKPLARIVLHSVVGEVDLAPVLALARGNQLARELTALAPNELTPATYRKRIRALAAAQGWQLEEYGFARLRKMGAGAFCAVAQGSDHEDAAIVHLAWRPKKAKRRLALVGKGICFDTGGMNLKPARYMQGMHEDMNGSAVVLGLMQAIAEMKLPVAVDAWLAIAHNHLSPGAYKQNDIVTALDGTTIEVVHTDAEGRMVLADTLTLASRRGDGKHKPELVVDFATLTGSMHSALGSRYSGVFATDDALAVQAVGAGRSSGERVCVFPLDADYEAGDSGLDSKVADVKQCTMEGAADHILAARFLKRFTNDLPWVHVDLSASNCGGGLGAVGTDITGFGVAWGATLVSRWLAD